LADGILTGGLETSASMIALGALALIEHRDTIDVIADTDRTVEELLRYLAVVQMAFPRFAIRDLHIGRSAIRTGDLVLCSLSAANRDGPGMDTLDPSRPPRPHFAFGHGIHRCVGAELARLEL